MKLDLNSKIDASECQFTHKWDTVYRQNFQRYQEQIDALTYGLQKSQRGFFIFGQSTYPNFHQRKLLNLNLYLKKQKLGEIFQNELDDFKQINENIAQDYNNTFNSSIRVPTKGIIAGAISFPIAHYFNLQYSFRLGLFCIPIAAQILNNTLQTESLFKTQEFLNWVLESRKAKASIEMNSQNYENLTQKYQKEFLGDNRPIKQRFNQLVELAQTEK